MKTEKTARIRRAESWYNMILDVLSDELTFERKRSIINKMDLQYSPFLLFLFTNIKITSLIF